MPRTSQPTKLVFRDAVTGEVLHVLDFGAPASQIYGSTGQANQPSVGAPTTRSIIVEAIAGSVSTTRVATLISASGGLPPSAPDATDITVSGQLGTGIPLTFGVVNAGGPISTYAWSFTVAGAAAGSSSAAAPQMTFSAAGSLVASVTVTGPGGSDTYSETIGTLVAPPDATDITATGQLVTNSPITFGVVNAGGPISTYAWTFTVAGAAAGSSSAAAPQMTFTGTGALVASVTVTGPAGASDTYSETVGTITAAPSLTPSFTRSPASVGVGQPVTLDNTSADIQGSDAWSWSFGDGNNSVAAEPGEHTYTAPGVRTISLSRVRGGTTYGPVTQQVTITAAPVTVSVTIGAATRNITSALLDSGRVAVSDQYGGAGNFAMTDVDRYFLVRSADIDADIAAAVAFAQASVPGATSAVAQTARLHVKRAPGTASTTQVYALTSTWNEATPAFPGVGAALATMSFGPDYAYYASANLDGWLASANRVHGLAVAINSGQASVNALTKEWAGDEAPYLTVDVLVSTGGGGGGSSLLWSQYAAGSPPADNQPVSIAVSDDVTFDMATASPGAVDVFGTLRFGAGSRTFRPHSIRVAAGGALLVGTEAAPWPRADLATIELRGPKTGHGTRYVINVPDATATGGRLGELWPLAGAVAETVTGTVSAGGTSIVFTGSSSGALGTAAVGSAFTATGNRFYCLPQGTFSAGQVITFAVVAKAFKADPQSRAILIDPGGRVELYAECTAHHYARADEHIAAGANTITLDKVVDWLAGEELLVCPTYYRGTPSGSTQAVTIQSIATVGGRSVLTLVQNVTAARWGRKQYPTDTGISLTQGTYTRPAQATVNDWLEAPNEIDERCVIAHMSRPIVVLGADDTEYQQNGFGGHFMWAGNTTIAKIRGVMFDRMGQAGVIGTYALHAHMCSYAQPNGMTRPSNGTFAGSVAGNQYARFCTGRNLPNRFGVIHGTHGFALENCVAVGSKGHTYFLEDGSEENNVISGNIAIDAVEPTSTNALLNHDIGSIFSGAPGGGSGFWISNPNNDVVNNIAVGCQGVGIWNAFGPRKTGMSQMVAGRPISTNIKLQDGNEGSYNGSSGMFTAGMPVNEIGDTQGIDYMATVDGTQGGALAQAIISGFRAHKNRNHGYFNNAGHVLYRRWVSTGNPGRGITGRTWAGQQNISNINHLLACARTLNDNGDFATVFPNVAQQALASYHGTVQIAFCSFFGYSPTLTGVDWNIGSIGENWTSVIGAIDHYEGPGIEMQFARMLRGENKFDSVSRTVISRPPQTDGNPMSGLLGGQTKFRNFTLNQALPDPSGFVTERANSTIVLNHPFVVDGLSDLQAIPGTPLVAGHYASTLARMAGVGKITFTEDTAAAAASNVPTTPVLAFTCTRKNATTGATIASFTIGDGAVSTLLPHMRTVAFQPLADVRLDYVFGDSGNVQCNGTINIDVAAANVAGDKVLLVFPRAGSSPVTQVTSTTNYNTNPPSAGDISAGYGRVLPSFTTFAALRNSPNGGYWHDTANSLLYVQHVGGINTNVPWAAQGYPSGSKPANNILWNLVRHRVQ